MDTKSNIPAEKKIVSVEILHLDELGYGPQGKHTRREWRKECLENLLAGKEVFENWQNNWQNNIKKIPNVKFSIELIYDDATKEKFFNRESEAIKPYSFDFINCTFKSKLFAQEITFNQIVNFSYSKFEKDANFRDATVAGSAYFRSVQFMEQVYFSYLTVTEDLIFCNVKVMKNAYFRNAAVAGTSDFGLTIFNGAADFSKMKCMGVANFSFVTVAKYLDFSSATFEKESNFSSAIFIGETDFRASIFEGFSNFSNLRFEGNCSFSGATFIHNASFFKANFVNKCLFESQGRGRVTSFFGSVNFENARILNVGHFERVHFKSEVPNFLGVDNSKTLLIFTNDNYFTKNDIQGNAVDRIAQLKRLSDEQGQTEQALMFNALELNAKAKQPNAGIWLKIFTFLYWSFSNYGRSFVRPLVSYLCLFAITLGVGLYCSMNSAEKKEKCEKDFEISYTNFLKIPCLTYVDDAKDIKLDGYRAAFEFAAYRGSGVIDFSDSDKQTAVVSERVFGQPIEPGWARALGIFKAIASTALLFLAALGLRNKYRIK
jgi:Pentapeptide repeats (9 copies)